ncbi:hypothetical protein BXZ70DRAFT_703108 [Cristinia sonorae]|uniref:AB hydrolase-1 domain-containing protein n=1 Tax=Cristinia sonorae TaxID=1940300 RepID=A0A8K0UE14_9AGAR|nr:hypothetical protein BXZ70DRAFT_703108 [Cristinia sonorae]
MPALQMSANGPLAVHDSGVPEGVETYTTLFIIHGYAWHSGVFARVLPHAAQYRTRIVLVNRRDYPGATPLSSLELGQLRVAKDAAPGTEVAVNDLRGFFKERAREIYQLLGRFIVSERIEKNSVVVLGWSLGVAFLSALLTYAPAFSLSEVNLNVAGYIKYVVAYDASQRSMGQPPPDIAYHPLQDPTSPIEKRVQQFSIWVSGYFRHPDIRASNLEMHDYQAAPRPTALTMSEDEMASAMYAPAGAEGGSDEMLTATIKHGVFDELRVAALLPAETSKRNEWARIRWRHIWGDRSAWGVPYSAVLLERELEEAKKAGKYTRPVENVCFEGANHFGHWDTPDRFMRIVLEDK